jgi:hypothetical protein
MYTWFFRTKLVVMILFGLLLFPNWKAMANNSNNIPEDYYSKYTNWRIVPQIFGSIEELVSALPISEVWGPEHQGRSIDNDPCDVDHQTGKIDDTIFWFKEGEFSSNFENGLKIFTNPATKLIFSQYNDGILGLSYGYYPEYMGIGRYSLCMDLKGFDDWQSVLLTIRASVWLAHESRLYQPQVTDAFGGSKRVTFRLSVSEYDNGDGIVVYKVKDGEQGKFLPGNDDFTFIDEDEEACQGKYIYWFATYKTGGKEWYSLHSKWSDPKVFILNDNCVGLDQLPITGGNDPTYPVTYTPTPQSQPTLTPTPTVVQCSETGWGAYLYNQYGSCFFVGRNQTSALPFSPVRLELRGDGINVKLCSTSNGSEPCSEVNNSTGDLSWSSIYGRFRSAKVSDGYTSNCPTQIMEFSIHLYSEFNKSGSCRVYSPGRYNNLPFSPRSLRFGSEFLVVQLCENNDGGNPCSEWHSSQDRLDDSSIFGRFHSAVISMEEPVIGNLSVGSISLSPDQRTLYFNAQNSGSGFATLLVQLVEDPDTSVLRQKQYIYTRNNAPVNVTYPVRGNTVCFWISIDPENYYGELDRTDNYDLWCKDGGHERVPANDSWIPEASIIVGDSYVFEPYTKKLRVRPDYGEGWNTTAQLVVLEGHRPNGWIMATPWSSLENIHPFNEAMRVEIINNLITRCNGDGQGCREAQEFRINENGTVQKIVHTQLLATPTVTPTSTPRPTATETRTPVPTFTSTSFPDPTVTATRLADSTVTPTQTVIVPTVTPTVFAEQSPTPTVSPTATIVSSLPISNTLYLPLVVK